MFINGLPPCATRVPATAEVRRQHQIPQTAFTEVSSREYLCQNPGPLQEQQIPFTPNAHLLSLNKVFKLFLQPLLYFPTINVLPAICNQFLL